MSSAKKKPIPSEKPADRGGAYQPLFEQAADAVFIIDANDGETRGRIVDLNEAACRMHGYTREELLGESIEMLDAPDNNKKIPKGIHSLKDGERLEFEIEHIRKDGSRFPVEAVVKLVVLDGDRYFVTTDRNTAHRKLNDKDIKKTLQIQTLSFVAGEIAHDFNNALSTIVTCIGIFRAKLDPDDRAMKTVAAAEHATHKAQELVANLATFTQGQPRVVVKIAPGKFLRRALEYFLSGSDVEYALTVDDKLDLITIDQALMGQVVHNLVQNAKEAMPDGGKLTVHCRRMAVELGSELPLAPGDYYETTFQDTGTGISDDSFPLIFDPYFTTKANHHGFGLTVALAIAKRHKGNLVVESEPGKGTLARLFLPAAKERASVSNQPSIL